jgi:hypothetical protein
MRRRVWIFFALVAAAYSSTAYGQGTTLDPSQTKGFKLLAGLGPNLASAATITPTNRVHHITGTTTIQTITATNVADGEFFTMIMDGPAPLGTAGNIKVGLTPVINTTVVCVYTIADSKWFCPAQIAATGTGSDFTSSANFQVQQTAKAAVVNYTAPAGAGVCTWEVSQANTFAPLVPDVSTTLFPGSSSDNRAGSVANGNARTFVVGQGGTGIEYAPVASDGKRYSRALQANTPHYGRVTCGSNFATVSFSTQNVIPGDQYPGTFWPEDPATPGAVAWPTIDPSAQNVCTVHPVTGLCFQPLLRPDFNSGTTADSAFHHQYQATGWTTPGNILTDDGALAVTSNTNPIVVTTNTWELNGPNNGQSLAGITLEIKGYVANACAAGDDSRAQVAITRDGVNPWTPFLDVTLPTQTAYGGGVTTNVGDDPTHPVAYMQAWFTGAQLIQMVTYRNMTTILNDLNPRFGNYDRSGNNLTLSYPGSAGNGLQWENFSTDWVAGSHFILDSGGTPTETTISSVTSATQATVAAGSGPTTNGQFIAPNFGFLIRKKTATCSMSIDYVHFQKTYYSTPLLNEGSSSSRQALLRKYPEGEVVTAASNASPIVLTLNSGITAHRFSAGNVIHCAQIQGNSAANGNFTIASATTFTVTLTGSTGNGAFTGNGFCYTTTPVARTGFILQGTSNGNSAQFFWINTDQVPAEIRYLGLGWSIAPGFPSDGLRGDNYSMDDSDPDSPGFYIAECSGGSPCGPSTTKQHIIRGTYLGNPTVGLMRDVGALADQGSKFTDAQNSWRWVDQTPTTTLTDQLAAFDAAFTGALAFEMSPVGMLNSTTVLLRGGPGPQNSASWTATWDTGTKTVSGLVNTWTSPNWRWKGQHGTNLEYGAAYVGRAGYSLNDPSSLYSGPYTSVLADTGLNNTAPQDCATLLAGIGQANPWGITGNNCSQTTLASITPVSQGLPVNHTFGPLIVGDLADMWTSANADEGETIRILGISGTTIVVQRALWSNHPIAAHPIGSKFWWRENPPKAAMAVGARQSFYSDTGWWDYVNDPHGTNTNDPYQQQTSNATVTMENTFYLASHIGGRFDHFISDSGPSIAYVDTCSTQAQIRPAGIRHGDYKSTTITCYNANPAFDGSAGGGVGAASMETHLGALIDNGTQAGRAFGDSGVYQISEGWQMTLAKVGGLTNWYLATGYNEFGNIHDYKRQKVNVWIGNHIGHNVSSPTYSISAHDSSADAYNYCRALAANDCLSGSSANDIYVNIPKFSIPPDNWPYGSGATRCLGYENFMAHDADDLCVSIEPIHADEMIQYASDAAHSDPKGTGQRRLGIPFSLPKRLNGTNLTLNTLPDGSGIASQANYLVNLPIFTWDRLGIDRTTWIPLPVTSPAAPIGTVNAYVRFGYNPSYFCSDRQEICVANAGTLQSGNSVYSYETSDSYAGLACTTSCTVVLPALSQRILWYQWVFRDGSNNVVATSPAQVLVTP